MGKSSIILRYTKNQFNASMVSSIGVDFKTKDIIVDNKKVKLQLWDTAGHERFRTITTSYYRGAHGIATVFDLTDRQTFEHVEKWLEEINKYAKENVMRFLIGNKSDLVDKRQVTYEEVRVLANKLNIYYVETSAKNNINVTEFFRIATQSHRIEMSQPFPVTRDLNDLEALDTTTDIGLAHNGILSQTSNGDKDLSDTAIYIRRYIAGKKITDDFVENLAEDTVGSRLAILNKDGEFRLTGSWSYENGLYFSNNNWRCSYGVK